jgi:diacylglycerol kinase (ATP)
MSRMPSARIVLNPTAGGGRARRMSEHILVGLEHRGVRATMVATTTPREATRLGLEAARAGVDLVVAAGGDGTIHETANGLLQALAQGVDGPVLGVLPVGSGNDFAKLIGPLDDLDRSLDILVEGSVRRFDAARAAWGNAEHWFINAAGTGIDVEVVRQILRTRGRATPGVARYLSTVLKVLTRYQAIPLQVRMNGQVLDRETMIIAVANGRCIGGGFWICPGAEPDDGRLDICIVNRVSYLGALRVLPLVMRGKHEKHPKVEMFRASHVEIEALGPDPLFFQLDGELHEPPDARTLSLRVVPKALPVMVASPPA